MIRLKIKNIRNINRNKLRYMDVDVFILLRWTLAIDSDEQN